MEIRLLTEHEQFGDNKLQVVEDYGTKTGFSDLAIILGGCLNFSNYKSTEGKRSGYVWTSSHYKDANIAIVDGDGNITYDNLLKRIYGVCPALPKETTATINATSKTLKLDNGHSINVVEYGEYPQTIASEKTAMKLEKEFQKQALVKTSKNYTFDSAGLRDYNAQCQPKQYSEYVFHNERYIRIQGTPCSIYSIMSNNEQVKEGQAYWVKVEPLVWLQDNTGRWRTKEAVFSHKFADNEDYNGDFSNTEISNFLNNVFAKEMMADNHQQSRNKSAIQEKIEQNKRNYFAGRLLNLIRGNLKSK